MSAFRETPMTQTQAAQMPDAAADYQGLGVEELARPQAVAPSELELARHAIEQEQQRCAALEESLQAAIAALQSAVAELRQAEARLVTDAPAELTEIALLLSERIIEHELCINPEIIVQCAKAVLNEPRSQGEVLLCLSRADVELLKEKNPDALQALEQEANVRFVADDQLPRGVCRLEGAGFRLEANIPRRLAAVWEEVTARTAQQRATADMGAATGTGVKTP
ncbi:MAG: hypothetical protein HY696_12865 [Deltaproteobacteria bacterium]|nr:hypothetical protein [Deltaproteobacteria bacterium]